MEIEKITDPSVSPLVRELRARATTLSYDLPYSIEGLEAIIPVLTTIRYWANSRCGNWYLISWLALFAFTADMFIASSRHAFPFAVALLGTVPADMPSLNRSACIVLALSLWASTVTGVTGIYFARCAILGYLPGWFIQLFDRDTQFATAIANYDGSKFDLARQVEPLGASELLNAILGASAVRLERLRDGYCYGRDSLRTLTWLPSYLAPYARLSDFIPEKIKNFSTNLIGVPVGNYLVSAPHKPGSIKLNPRDRKSVV